MQIIFDKFYYKLRVINGVENFLIYTKTIFLLFFIIFLVYAKFLVYICLMADNYAYYQMNPLKIVIIKIIYFVRKYLKSLINFEYY